MLELDHQYPDRQVAGTDEAGRGPLCGPVYAAAVILHPGRPIMALNDSKQLTERRREALFEQIQTEAMAWCIAHCTAAEIDRYNILQASHLAMVRAIEGLCTVPGHVLVDGNRVPKTLTLPAEAVVKGDGRHSAIAAASILAKVARDRCMATLDSQYPGYGLASNKGYPTAAHRLALSRLGATPEHRRSFAPVRMALAERQTDTARAPVTEQGTLEL